jgi:hypothetical protein
MTSKRTMRNNLNHGCRFPYWNSVTFLALLCLRKVTIVYKQYKHDCLNTSMGLFNISLLSCDAMRNNLNHGCRFPYWNSLKSCWINIIILQYFNNNHALQIQENNTSQDKSDKYGNLHPWFKLLRIVLLEVIAGYARRCLK